MYTIVPLPVPLVFFSVSQDTDDLAVHDTSAVTFSSFPLAADGVKLRPFPPSDREAADVLATGAKNTRKPTRIAGHAWMERPIARPRKPVSVLPAAILLSFMVFSFRKVL